MSRLIDADKLIEELKNLAKGQVPSCPNVAEFFVSIRVDRIIDMLNNQPTAFDVEKVREQLENKKFSAFMTLANTGDKQLDEVYENVGNCIDDVLEIVKAGGLDDNM